jgi:hypothetical protein
MFLPCPFCFLGVILFQPLVSLKPYLLKSLEFRGTRANFTKSPPRSRRIAAQRDGTMLPGQRPKPKRQCMTNHKRMMIGMGMPTIQRIKLRPMILLHCFSVR